MPVDALGWISAVTYCFQTGREPGLLAVGSHFTRYVGNRAYENSV